MKHNRVYVIDGIPAYEFYEKNATDLDFYMNGDYELMSCNKVSEDHHRPENEDDSDLTDDVDSEDLPF
jgi:hypothetical protein